MIFIVRLHREMMIRLIFDAVLNIFYFEAHDKRKHARIPLTIIKAQRTPTEGSLSASSPATYPHIYSPDIRLLNVVRRGGWLAVALVLLAWPCCGWHNTNISAFSLSLKSIYHFPNSAMDHRLSSRHERLVAWLGDRSGKTILVVSKM